MVARQMATRQIENGLPRGMATMLHKRYGNLGVQRVWQHVGATYGKPRARLPRLKLIVLTMTIPLQSPRTRNDFSRMFLKSVSFFIIAARRNKFYSRLCQICVNLTHHVQLWMSSVKRPSSRRLRMNSAASNAPVSSATQGQPSPNSFDLTTTLFEPFC